LNTLDLDSQLTHFFHPDELEVVLSEILYLPFFLRKGDISTPRQIIDYGLMDSAQIMGRLAQIIETKPVFDKNCGVCKPLLLSELRNDVTNLEKKIGDWISTSNCYAVIGPTRQVAFSAAMYLIEEGLTVMFYSTGLHC